MPSLLTSLFIGIVACLLIGAALLLAWLACTATVATLAWLKNDNVAEAISPWIEVI
ncbi:hypothetical protein [Neptuniibacter sp.]|uniref:hypothetical protein n=1 Tax=Neptuniibacter sp. TaxID=1962643 RepID=UPI00260484C9|nr:hypothetical protein [Neptuniibacter sp.]MCP4596173.1 hypothetical protein [Neptuniibacter sp.]